MMQLLVLTVIPHLTAEASGTVPAALPKEDT